jgi:hypothetical protein
MNYEEFLSIIKTEKLSKEDYYANLVIHKDEILLDIQRTTQQEVALKLNMSRSKLSSLLNLLSLKDLKCY